MTTGIVGMIAWTVFFASAMLPMVQATRRDPVADPALANLPKLGLLIVFLFLIGQVRIEFLREDYFDYQSYIFVMLALFVGTSHLILRQTEQWVAKVPLSVPPGRIAQPESSSQFYKEDAPVQ